MCNFRSSQYYRNKDNKEMLVYTLETIVYFLYTILKRNSIIGLSETFFHILATKIILGCLRISRAMSKQDYKFRKYSKDHKNQVFSKHYIKKNYIKERTVINISVSMHPIIQ